jgi:hypothetical protein
VHGDEGDAVDVGRQQDSVDLAVMLARKQCRPLPGQELAAAHLDRHAADPAHAPAQRPGIALQQRPQRDRAWDRRQHDADQRR